MDEQLISTSYNQGYEDGKRVGYEIGRRVAAEMSARLVDEWGIYVPVMELVKRVRGIACE